jgi:hypothetical protein
MKDRAEALKVIDEKTIVIFNQKIRQNLSISDHIVRKWAIKANKEIGHNKIANFTASKSWLLRFKKRHRIVSRKVSSY